MRRPYSNIGHLHVELKLYTQYMNEYTFEHIDLE